MWSQKGWCNKLTKLQFQSILIRKIGLINQWSLYMFYFILFYAEGVSLYVSYRGPCIAIRILSSGIRIVSSVGEVEKVNDDGQWVITMVQLSLRFRCTIWVEYTQNLSTRYRKVWMFILNVLSALANQISCTYDMEYTYITVFEHEGVANDTSESAFQFSVRNSCIKGWKVERFDACYIVESN